MNALDLAIQSMPNKRQQELADALGVTYEAVRKWRIQGVPAERCKQIEELTSGKVTRRELRPDIFGPIGGAVA